MKGFAEDLARDPQAFEGFLTEQGYSPARARAIAAKGFWGGESQSLDAARIADLVTALKVRKAALELKRGAAKFPTMASAVEETVKIITSAYRAVTGTRQPFYLFEGDKVTFDLGLTSIIEPTVQVVMPRGGFHYFEARIHYWSWEYGALKWRKEELYFRPNENKSTAVLRTGSLAGLQTFIKRNIPPGSDAGGTAEFSNVEVLERFSDMLRSPAPKGELSYTRYFLDGPISEQTRNTSQAFRVIAS